MPMAAAATVTLFMVRILKTPLGNSAAPTHDKLRVSTGVISELLNGADGGSRTRTGSPPSEF